MRPSTRNATFLARRRDGAAVRATSFRCRRHGACHFLRPRSRQGRGRNGSGGSAGRTGCRLCVGCARRRLPVRSDLAGNPSSRCHARFFPPIHPPANWRRFVDLWTDAGLEAVETREIVVERTFPTFEDYWATSTITGGVRPALEALSVEQREKLKARVARAPANRRYGPRHVDGPCQRREGTCGNLGAGSDVQARRRAASEKACCCAPDSNVRSWPLSSNPGLIERAAVEG